MKYPLQSPVVAGRKRFTSEELANLDVSCQAILTWRGITPITDAQHEQVCSLMAAAPALLRALEGMVSDWERVTGRSIPDDHEAKAAITKAKGGAL